jgi:hypothetical protein
VDGKIFLRIEIILIKLINQIKGSNWNLNKLKGFTNR